MKIIVSNELQIFGLRDALFRKIRDTFTLRNPAYDAAEKMGRWTGNLDEYLRFYTFQDGAVTIPRGALGLLLYFCKGLGIGYQLDDRRRMLPEVDFTFDGTLKGYQQSATADILSRDFGVLQAPTGSGKTVMALSIIAKRRQPTLIICHTKELLSQWVDRIMEFLAIPRAEIGIIGNGKHRIGEQLTVGIINSIYPIAGSLKNHFGHIVVDECHRCPSRTFSEAVASFDCRYMLGLSATPYRRDRLTKLIGWHLGRTIAVNKSDLSENDIIQNVEVVVRETAFVTDYDASAEYSQMLSELTLDSSRNRLIVGDIIKEASNGGGVCLVLSDRKEHCHALQDMLSKQGMNADVLTGSVCNGERKTIVERLHAGKVKVLIATGQLIGEGFDCKGLSTLHMACPIKFSGRLIQYLGRVMRTAPGKDKATIYDYADSAVPVLAASARARQRVYRSIDEDKGENR